MSAMSQETKDMLAERGRSKSADAYERFRAQSVVRFNESANARRVALAKLVRDFRADHNTPITLGFDR